MACLFGKHHSRTWSTKGKRLGGYIRQGAMTSIEQTISDQPGITPQFNGSLTHARFCSTTVFGTTNQITDTPTRLKEPQQNRAYNPRRHTDAWLPPMDPESVPTERTMEYSQIPPSRRTSGASDRKSDSVECDLIIRMK